MLRLWAATVESGKDTPIGPTVLAQCTQTHRKIRYTARFILGNLGDMRQSVTEKVKREDMGLVSISVLSFVSMGYVLILYCIVGEVCDAQAL